jgi:hypothetical protein
MKKYAIVTLTIVTLGLLSAAFAYGDMPTMMSQTGKVTAVDPQGKAIVITVGKGDQALDVGTIVQPDTKLMVDGKSVAVTNLPQDVKVGDKVTLRYEKTNDLYAKEIVKR